MDRHARRRRGVRAGGVRARRHPRLRTPYRGRARQEPQRLPAPPESVHGPAHARLPPRRADPRRAGPARDALARGPGGRHPAPGRTDRCSRGAARPAGRRERRGAHVKVAIAGAGNVGTYIASDLKEAGHEVLLIEQDPDLVARLRTTLDVEWFIADACEVRSLHAAGLADADVVVAATGDDEDNLVVSLLAKQEFAVPRVVARVNHPANQWLFDEGWGVGVSVPTPHRI